MKAWEKTAICGNSIKKAAFSSTLLDKAHNKGIKHITSEGETLPAMAGERTYLASSVFCGDIGEHYKNVYNDYFVDERKRCI
jgi:hypothetical protein